MSNSEIRSLTFLHISDLHFKSHVRHDQNIVLNQLLEKISELAKGDWRPDLILCTGDIAFSGKPNQYETAGSFFDKLLRITDINSKDRLFVVPGNHDVDWNKLPRLRKSIRNDAHSDNFFNSKDTLKAFLEQFQGYQTFSREYLNRPFDEDNYCFAIVVEISGFQIGIAALNSAWLVRKRYGQGKQLLGKLPLMKALKELQDIDLRVVMFHHPLPWLLEFEQHTIRTLLEKYADLILNGHQNKTDIDIHHLGAERKVLYIQAGPCHMAKPWPNRVHFIRWEIDGRHKIVRVYPLKFDREIDRWVLDTTIFPDRADYIGFFDMGEVKMRSVNLISEEIGIEYNLYHSESDIKMDGSADVKRTVDLQVIGGEVSSLDYHHFSRSTESYSVAVSKISGISNVSVSIVNDSPTNLRFSVDFNPPLKKGQKIVFQTKEKYVKGYPMTMDLIAEYIRTGKWAGEPYTYKSKFVKLPTKELVLCALLPESYKITTGEEFFDVRVGFYGGSRHREEYKRLRKMNCFSRDTVKGKQILKLTVPYPKIGLVYLIKWRPPTKRDYERLCKTS